MQKLIRKTASSRWLILLLLLTSAPAFAQRPAPQTSPPASRDIHARVTETVIDASIPDDSAVDKMLAAYSPKVRALDVVIGKLKGELRKSGTGSGSLGNFVADGMRAEASIKPGKPVDLALMNGGGLRRNAIGEGKLRARDIFELLPFENALITLELNGEQLISVLELTVGGEAQSGARVTYKTNADKKSEFESAKLLDIDNHERDIDPKATYTLVTIDYLYRVGGNRYGILREGKNVKELGITLRDAIIAYVNSETAAGRDIKPNLDGRFVQDKASSVLTEAPPND